MPIEVSYSDKNFTITGITPVSDERYRARLFLTYSGKLSYVGTEGEGLTVNGVSGVLYDDWNCSFRPPRIDAHEFNCEIVVPLDTSGTSITLVGDGDVGGESIVDGSLENPANVLIEMADATDLEVDNIKVDGNQITVTTAMEHGFKKGDAITIYNADYACHHVLGPDGMRIIGTFKLVSVTSTTFTYVTNHYVMPSETLVIDGTGWTCCKWVAYVYEQLSGCDPESYPIKLDMTNGFEKGDTVYIQSNAFKVVDTASDGVFVEYEGTSELELDVEENVLFAPRTPSAAIPVNWGMSGTVRVSDASPYDHTTNTYFVTPYLDTYFTKDDDVIHIGEPTLKCAGGNTPSVICLKFPNITMEVDYGQSARLRMYVAKMSYSEAMVSLYQMDSNGWREDMSYDEVMTHVTQIPVATASLTNPALMDMPNLGENTPDLGSYNSYVDFEIDSIVLAQWLSGNTSYSPSVCMKMLSGGNPVIEFNSTESGDMVPYFIVTGGEDAVLGQEPFDIIVENPSTEPGKIIRVEVDDPDATFGNSLYDNVVKINGVEAVIMNGSPYYIDVLVPETVAGVSQVQVFKKVRNKEVVLTNPTTVYVNNDLTKRNVRLAAKKNPGEITGKTSRSALYNRDLGYSNFKEVTDETSLLQNVYSCLLTSQGERLFNQNFGTHIEDRIFTLGNTTGEIDLLKECIETVEKYEPRVQIDPERSSCIFDENGCYNLVLAVVLPTARTEMLKFTFKNRGRIV